MTGLQRYRRATVWIATVALLWLSVAPAFAHMLQWVVQREEPWREVCSAASLESGRPGNPGTALHGGATCLCCAPVFAHLGPAPALPLIALPLVARGVATAPGTVPHAAAPTWRSGQPRAPPLRA